MNFMSYVFVENGASHSHDGKKSYIGLHEVNLHEVLVGKSYRKDTKINIDLIYHHEYWFENYYL